MAATVPCPVIWEQIERSESYLVCCMFSEAAVLASSVLKQIKEDEFTESEGIQLLDIMEAAGMVLVQAWKELGSSAEVLNELKEMFGSVTAIPVQVLLAGACIQISEGFPFGCQQLLEEFLSKWRYMDEQYYVLIGEEANVGRVGKSDGPFVLKVDEFLEVVEVYVNIIGMVLGDIDRATSWVENAVLPEGRRQELLRRLHSLCSLKETALSSQGSPLPTTAQAHKGSSLKKENLFVESQNGSSEGNIKKQAFLKLSGQAQSCFWWFRTITLKFGRIQFVISNGKILLGCLTFFVYYILRKKQETLKRLAKKQATSMKKALVDLWQLAFSYQVNPLAAVQSLPSATHGRSL